MDGKHALIDKTAGNAGPAAGIALRHGNKPDALLEILHDLQESQGFITETAIPVLADALNLSRAEVYGVLSFYHDFRREPGGRHVVKVCRAESCQAMGARALEAAAQKTLQVPFGGTTSDGAITLEAVYCLGNCHLSPNIQVDGKTLGRMDAQKFGKIAAELRA